MGSKSHKVKGTVGKTIGNTQDGSKGKLRRSKAKVRWSSVKETIKEMADRDCRQDPQDGPRPVAQGRAGVRRAADRPRDRARPGQHGWGSPGPSKSEFARATDKRAARPPTRSRKG